MAAHFHAADYEPLELAGSEPVPQQPWQEAGGSNAPPLKYKYVALHKGPGPAPPDADTIYLEAAPQTRLGEQAERTRVSNELDYPHYVGFKRGEGEEGAKHGSYDITGQGKAAEIMSHAVRAIRELAEKYRPMEMHFVAMQPSRTRAYAYLMHRLAADKGVSQHYLFRGDEDPLGHGGGLFYVVHRSVAHLPEYRGLPSIEQMMAKAKAPVRKPAMQFYSNDGGFPPGMRYCGPSLGLSIRPPGLPPGMSRSQRSGVPIGSEVRGL